MKKAVSLCLLILILISFAAPSLQVAAENEEKDFSDAVSYTCTLDESTGKIVVDGTVNHDVMIKYPDYRILLYAVAPGERVRDVISDPDRSPLAGTPMTIKFTFSISAQTSTERYSKYAIIFSSSIGERHVAGTPKYPAVSSDFEYLRGDRSAYKAVLCESASLSADVGAGMAVVDVDIGKIRGETADPVLYPVNDTYISFDRAYVRELDKKIITASVSGAKIYLRFLLSATDEELCIAVSDDAQKRGFPNIYDDDTLGYISSLSKFLMDRYSDGKGNINGVIVGDRVDDVTNTNYVGDMSIDQYADAYVLYLTIVAGAMRMTDAAFDIVIPISDKDGYTSDGESDTSASDFFDYVITELEYGTSGNFKCSVMVQSDVVPFGITSDNVSDGIDTEADFGAGKLHADNIKHFSDHIRRLSYTYVSAPSNIIFMWEPPAELVGSALNVAYTYIYYRLYGQADISSLVVNTSSVEQFLQLADTVTYIDTQRGAGFTAPLLKYFRAESWQEVVGENVDSVDKRERFEVSALQNGSKNKYSAEFVYYEFSDYNVFSNTSLGENGKSVYSKSDFSGKRSLQLLTEPLGVGELAECTYILDYVESFKYTPVIALTVGVEDKAISDSALYEIRLTIGEDTSRAVCSAVMENGTTQTLFFDVSDFNAELSADYVRISVRPLTNGSEECTVRIYDLRGYSNTCSSDELSSFIEQDRDAWRNTQDDDEGESYRLFISIVCILFALTAVGAGLFMAFRKEDNKKRSERE